MYHLDSNLVKETIDEMLSVKEPILMAELVTKLCGKTGVILNNAQVRYAVDKLAVAGTYIINSQKHRLQIWKNNQEEEEANLPEYYLWMRWIQKSVKVVLSRNNNVYHGAGINIEVGNYNSYDDLYSDIHEKLVTTETEFVDNVCKNVSVLISMLNENESMSEIIITVT